MAAVENSSSNGHLNCGVSTWSTVLFDTLESWSKRGQNKETKAEKRYFLMSGDKKEASETTLYEKVLRWVYYNKDKVTSVNMR